MHNYPPVPAPKLVVGKEPLTQVPKGPGVYFVWGDIHTVDYVGQSVNLKRRCKRWHDRIHVGDLLSWLELPIEELTFHEAYYIGLCRPGRNGGQGGRGI